MRLAFVDVVYLLGFLRPFTVTAVLASIILALGIAFHTAATWDKDEDLWEAIGIIATGPLFLLHKNFNWSGFVPKSATFREVRRSSGEVLLLAAAIAWSPVWIIACLSVPDIGWGLCWRPYQ